MLKRDELVSGLYLDHFKALPQDSVWSAEALTQSREAFLKARPDVSNDIWLFAYGSLIWNPTLKFAERARARLSGWHRSFCMHLVAGRATLDQPGRMLSLEPGGWVDGIAYRLSNDASDLELATIWLREMITGAYVPQWLDIDLEDGRVQAAVVFTASTQPAHWCADSSPEAVASAIAAAVGPLGSNADYVQLLAAALSTEGFEDQYVDRVMALLLAGRCAAVASAVCA